MELTWVKCRLCERELDCYTFKGWLSIHPCRCCRVKYRLFKWIRKWWRNRHYRGKVFD